MRTWRQLAPFLIGLSLFGNVWFGVVFYKQAYALNLYTWGNMVDRVWQDVNNAGFDPVPPSGRVSAPSSRAFQALETLELLQSLPYYSERADFDDLQTLRQFLNYANKAYGQAYKEQSDSGTISPETARRLAKIHEGMEFILTHQRQTNELKSSQNPWNHAGWRAVWHDIATGLRAMDFDPLP